MASPPQITSILPTSGPTTGGTQVILSGSGLSTATGVAFGALSTTAYVVDNDSLVFVQSPPALAAGPVPIIVITPSGNSAVSADTEFNYTAPPAAPASTSTSSTPSSSSSSGSTSSGATTGSSTSGNNGSTSSSSGTAPATSGSSSSTTGSTPSTTPAAGTTSPSTTSPGTTVPPSGSTTPSAPAPTPTSGSPNTPANYYPGGLAPVPGGLTGLGGSAGTGAGFGVGTLMAGGGGSAPPSNLPYYTDPGITAQLVQTLIGLVQNAASPQALEAQTIILRRMALEGDVIGSRIPPPRNISEIGGYLNLLGGLKEKAMREQTLAGILGVAGPSMPLGWVSTTLPLSMVAVTNDRPPVAAQASFPLTVLVRSDFVSGVQAAQNTIHGYGATLPLTSPSVINLPPGGTGTTPPSNILFYLGRTLQIAPSAALINPSADPVALVRLTGTTNPFVLASNILNTGTNTVTPANLDAIQCTPTQAITQLVEASFLPLAPILAAAGYYSASPLPVPASNTSLGWTLLTNTMGLVAGSTLLGDELSLLYNQSQIAGSVFAAMLQWTWNGTAFVA